MLPRLYGYEPGMAKVSDSRGGSSYKDLGLSLGGV